MASRICPYCGSGMGCDGASLIVRMLPIPPNIQRAISQNLEFANTPDPEPSYWWLFFLLVSSWGIVAWCARVSQ